MPNERVLIAALARFRSQALLQIGQRAIPIKNFDQNPIAHAGKMKYFPGAASNSQHGTKDDENNKSEVCQRRDIGGYLIDHQIIVTRLKSLPGNRSETTIENRTASDLKRSYGSRI